MLANTKMKFGLSLALSAALSAAASQSAAEESPPRLTTPGWPTLPSEHEHSEYAELARILIEAGADPNAKDNDGETPLHQAVEFENAEAAKLLIEAGADPNAKNNNGETPLHKATEAGPASEY